VPRYKLTIAYDGTDFCGWQKQEPVVPLADDGKPVIPKEKIAGTVHFEGEERPRLQLRTVQHAVETAVIEIVRERIVLHGSSRTDSGVHATGQVAAFTCLGDDELDRASGGVGWPLSRGTDRLLRALNGRLPDDILVTAVESVPLGFNPITHTERKAYTYTIHASPQRALWDRRFVHQIWHPIEAGPMQEAAAHLVGEHDFAAFAAAGHGRMSTVRTIYECSVTQIGPERIQIYVCGSGFLWNMVRIIAGTLAEVGRGRMAASAIPEIIASKQRDNAGPTLPPTGLRLEWIKFRDAIPDVPQVLPEDASEVD